MRSPTLDRKEVVALRKFIDQPLPNVYIRTLRASYNKFMDNEDALALIDTIREVQDKMGETETKTPTDKTVIQRDDLKLICFDYVWT